MMTIKTLKKTIKKKTKFGKKNNQVLLKKKILIIRAH